MSDVPYKVIVVVDPHFGEKLASLPSGVPVWIADSDANTPAAHHMWKVRPGHNHLTGITTFHVGSDSSPEENLINEFDMIDLPHGVHSANPPYSEVEVFGTSLTDRIRSLLSEHGFTQFALSSEGFVASRSVRVARSQTCDAGSSPTSDVAHQQMTEASVLLQYRSRLDAPIPVSTADVFRGLFFGFLGLLAFSLAVVMADLAYSIHFGRKGWIFHDVPSGVSAPPSSIGPGLVAVFSLFGGSVLFRLARRAFASKATRSQLRSIT